MKKRRITLNLDEDIVEALRAKEDTSVSAAVNAALRELIEADAHRAALLAWLDELNQQYGYPSDEDYAAADDLLDEAGFGGQRRDARPGAA
jgi:Arc/MetJ-type ribon-helix-helix transcriptional regulator